MAADGCTAVGQTVGETDGHPTVITRQCDVGKTDKQTDRHPTVIIRAYGGGRIGGRLQRRTSGGRLSTDGRVHSCRTDRQTD